MKKNLLALALAVALSTDAAATVIYTNGGPSTLFSPGLISAPPYPSGDMTADRFTLALAATLTGIELFIQQNTTTPGSLKWSITSGPNSGTVYGSAQITPSLLGSGAYGGSGNPFLLDELISGLSVALAAGTYWLDISNASGASPGWNTNGGPSLAWTDGSTNPHSQAFTLTGNVAAPALAEPGSVALLGVSLLAFGLVRRRKGFSQA